jgi:hypothetical protein
MKTVVITTCDGVVVEVVSDEPLEGVRFIVRDLNDIENGESDDPTPSGFIAKVYLI